MVAVVSGIVAAIGVAFVAAIVLAVIDLYLTGHSLRSISSPVIAGISAADVVLLVTAAIAGVAVATLVWRLDKRR